MGVTRVYSEGLFLELLLPRRVVVVGFDGPELQFASVEHAGQQDVVASAARMLKDRSRR